MACALIANQHHDRAVVVSKLVNRVEHPTHEVVGE